MIYITLRSLQGLLPATDQEMIRRYMELRFKDHTKFITPEALIIYEQRLLEPKVLLELCTIEYGYALEVPRVSYLPKDIINHFEKFKCIPFRYDTLTDTIHVAVVPELDEHIEPYRHTTTEVHYVPVYYYVEQYIIMYSSPDFLYRMPVKDLFDFIVREAIDLEASEITIANTHRNVDLFYGVRKKKVRGKRLISKSDVRDISTMICSIAGRPRIDGSGVPKYLSIDLDEHHRGRVVITDTYYGEEITVRVLQNETLNETLETLNIDTPTREFVRDVFLSEERGLRLLIGPTSSGKNTTILAALNELVATDKYKVVSAEMPVEIIVDGIIQHNSETEEQYALVTQSLIRQNPDLLYATEITDMTAKHILNIANTGKVVFSSLHANSIAHCISRLYDITKESTDRIILNLQSCIYQDLVRIEEQDKLIPVTNCLYFSSELKARLIGKSLGEIYLILVEEEKKWS